MEFTSKQLLSLACLMLLNCFVACVSQTQHNITTDQLSLLAFKSQIRFDSNSILATNWSASTDVCKWFGVGCSSSFNSRRVISLRLPNMGLRGIASSSLGNLSFLTVLIMRNNSLGGDLPYELSFLSRLTFIDLASNMFSGVLPSWLGTYSELCFLSAASNEFTGTVPSSLGNLSKLEALLLTDNQLTGQIPDEIGKLASLANLTLATNKLSGSIPSFIFNISSLVGLDLRFNSFSGSLPPGTCDGLPNLQILYLTGNSIDGEIPLGLSKCKNLLYFFMADNKLTGGIPSEIGNLTLLQELRLHRNNLRGEIPQEIGHLHNLQILSISNNQLTGSVPPSVYNMSFLEILYVANNSLYGSLPQDMCNNLRSLNQITLLNNKFEGSIPRGIGNCSSLVLIDLGSNSFTGEIPHEIGSLNKLEILFLAVNSFSGEIPFEIFNSTAMTYISLALNLLTGELPSSMGLWLPNIEKLYLGNNRISGTIPRYLSNATKLQQLSIGSNTFTGHIPDTLGDLRLLELLDLGINYLTRDPADPGLGFLTSLTKCRNLWNLGFENTALNAALPNSIGNFSSSLQQIFAYGCQLRGHIPNEIGNLSSLITLELSNNRLTGYIPATLGNLQDLQDLSISRNNLIGLIPIDIFRIRKLAFLRLMRNELSGAIPMEIGNLTSLRELVLAANRFSSTIPSTLWNLEDVLILDLTSNSLKGNIPMEVVNLKAACQIGLSGNQLTGSIPEITKGLENLNGLFLNNNRLDGPIPDSISNLISLEYLDLSHNNLSGTIPKSMTSLVNLKNFNVSFNNLEGEVPRTGSFSNFSAALFAMNKGLCGGAPQMDLPICKTLGQHRSSQLLLKIGTPVAAFVALAILLTFLWSRRKTKKGLAEAQNDPEDSPLALARITYQEIQQATDGFNDSNLLGTGGFGSVYKGVLSNGMTVAVKVFNTQNDSAFQSFQSECEVMRSVRHRNLVKIISSCSNNLDFMALVLQYMPNGNLETWLHSHTHSLTLIQRLDIMLDVASAMKYLHHDLPTPVIHCDLKPSNVLLDQDMTAHVSDFGVAKLLGQDQFLTQTMTLATIGYMAPEYGGAGVVSTKGDVYSFGILLIETFTGKRPTDDEFNDELSLRDYAIASLHRPVTEISEADLLDESDLNFEKIEQCVRSVLSLATNCTEELHVRRISMNDVVSKLTKIKDAIFLNVDRALNVDEDDEEADRFGLSLEGTRGREEASSGVNWAAGCLAVRRVSLIYLWSSCSSVLGTIFIFSRWSAVVAVDLDWGLVAWERSDWVGLVAMLEGGLMVISMTVATLLVRCRFRSVCWPEVSLEVGLGGGADCARLTGRWMGYCSAALPEGAVGSLPAGMQTVAGLLGAGLFASGVRGRCGGRALEAVAARRLVVSVESPSAGFLGLSDLGSDLLGRTWSGGGSGGREWFGLVFAAGVVGPVDGSASDHVCLGSSLAVVDSRMLSFTACSTCIGGVFHLMVVSSIMF
ncbi:unnamed protein product [Rhodiola kirilowii]